MQVVNLTTAPLPGKGAVLSTGSGLKIGKSKLETGPMVFSYSIVPQAPYIAMNCSVGVNVDGVLVRTLFSNESKPAGKYFGYWDGNDDVGYPVPRAGKKVKFLVLLNNLEFVWHGGWGNNSRDQTGLGKHRGGDPNASLCLFTDNKGVLTVSYKHGFEEGAVPPSGFAVDNMHVRVDIATRFHGSGLSIDHQATDNKILLNSGGDPYHTNHSFIFATNISDQEKTVFANGTVGDIGTGVDYESAVDILFQPVGLDTGLPTGLTVGAGFAFHSRGRINQLSVIDLKPVNGKPSGSVVQRITSIIAPGKGVVDGSYLWLAHDGNQFSRFVIAADGNLTPDALAITDMPVVVVGASIWQNELRLDLGGDRQTVRIYNKNTGALIRENHVVGGAKLSTIVTDDTLLNYFEGREKGDIISLPNGDYILAVPGLWRTARYTATGQLVEKLCLVPRNYGNVMCQNAPHINYAGHHQFAIDHAAADYRLGFELVKCRTMFSLPNYQGASPNWNTMFPSGKVFGQLGNFNYGNTGYHQTIVEVTDTGYRFVRDVNVEASLYPDFSLRWQEVRFGAYDNGAFAHGGYICCMQQDCLDPLAADPAWGPEYIREKIAIRSKMSPPANSLRGEVTGNGSSVCWSGALQWEEEDSFHLTLAKNGREMARGYRALPQTPLIPFHKHGRFRTAGWARGIDGNGTKYIVSGGSSSRCQVFGPNREIIRFHFHDEFNNVDIQSNQNVYYHECGLMLTTFGNTGSELNGDNSAYNACGNAMNTYTHWIPGLNVWRTVYSGETVHGIHFFDTLNLESIQLIEIEA